MNIEPPVKLERLGKTATIRLNRPESRNALGPDMRAALADAIAEVRDDNAVRTVILAGSGGGFCGGGDVKALATARSGPRDVFEGRSRLRDMHRWFGELADLEKPVIAAVDGAAFGAGLSLTLAADFVFATPRSTFCAVFARIGYVPDLASMYLLPRKIGLTRAKDLAFSARTVSAEEALSLGLIDQIVSGDVEQFSGEYAARFHAGPSGAIGLTKSILNRAFESDRDSVCLQEAMAQAICRESDFHGEAVERFIARKPPLYDWDA